MLIHHRSLSLVAPTLALVLLVATPLSAHETGAIHVSAKEVAAGSTVTVRGEKLPKRSELKLELRGILDNYPVGTVTTDTGGAFRMPLAVPQSVPAGAYTLVVIASDGDVTARADLAVSAATTTTATTTATGAPPAGGMAGMSGMAAMPGMGDEQASAEPMTIAHTTTPAEWAVIWTIIIASLAGGVILVRRRPEAGGRRPVVGN